MSQGGIPHMPKPTTKAVDVRPMTTSKSVGLTPGRGPPSASSPTGIQFGPVSSTSGGRRLVGRFKSSRVVGKAVGGQGLAVTKRFGGPLGADGTDGDGMKYHLEGLG
uniref:Uncharacterized protein n=1 Tax=Eutreptiella gymnastica TaxID=73025 RepID=A0A7S4D2T4_9EUGL